MTWRGSTTIWHRILACLPYILPLVHSIHFNFGYYLFRDFPPLQLLLYPLNPFLTLIRLPFAELIIFFLLFLLVVRNERIPHFIRFNTMQAILIDILVILCQVVATYVLKPVIQIDFILQTLFTTVFLGVVATISYSIFQSVRGNYAEIPTLSDAVHMQVR